MSRLTSRLIMVFVLLSCLLSACTGQLKPKTVIIPDTIENKEPDKVNEEFVVNKIYTIPDTGVIYGGILGWLDPNQVLGVYGSSSSFSFERVDYKFNSHKKIMDVNYSKQAAQLSPDGTHIAYFESEEANTKLMLLDLANNQKTVIKENVAWPFLIDPIKWSNNSQYISYGKGNEKDKGGSLVVYDLTNKSTNEYQVPSWNTKLMQLGANISDDGKHALLIKEVDNQYNLIYGELRGNEFFSQFEQPVNLEGAFDYINENQILFISLGGALSMYDHRNETITTLLEHMGTFQLSADRKYMAYSREKEEVFVGKLQGNNIINEKSIYKGLIPYQLQWSPDNKKILLSGRKLYPSVEPAPARVPTIVAEAPSQDSLPFIIEFK